MKDLKNFYPTNRITIERVLEGLDLKDKIVLEPSAGRGDFIEAIFEKGAKTVYFYEIEKEFRAICKSKGGTYSGRDFLDADKYSLSSVQVIIMNPPFDTGCKHILNAYEVAPYGCEIRALCNFNTLGNPHTQERRELLSIIENYGSYENIGDAFSTADRKTSIDIGFIKINKPLHSYKTEFEGFYDEEEEERYAGEDSGIMPYNFLRDLVDRYISAVKLFDKQLVLGQEMNAITGGFFSSGYAVSVSAADKELTRDEFKEQLQVSGWQTIFDKLNMEKYATTDLKADIRAFIEQQKQIPFTVPNIRHMIETVIKTTGERMDKALEIAFDSVTKHYSENRHNVEGWKTNDHYKLNKTFILPRLAEVNYDGEMSGQIGSTTDKMEDFLKAICYISGEDYYKYCTLYSRLSEDWMFTDEDGKQTTMHAREYARRGYAPGSSDLTTERLRKDFGKWMTWACFDIKVFKKGTIHFRFKDTKLLDALNARVGKIKGHPLAEKV